MSTRLTVAALGLLALMMGCPDRTLEIPPKNGTADDIADVTEVAEVEVADGSDAVPAPAAVGEPCTADAQCASGGCRQGPDGMTCAAICDVAVDACAPFETCTADGFCVSTLTTYCQPCLDDGACEAPGPTPTKCVDTGEEGSFCALACDSTADCPAGSECWDVGDGTTWCLPPGECVCSAAAIAAEAATTCGTGACVGARFCGADGLSQCVGPEPDDELCDGVDNDCDGQVDEDTCLDAIPNGTGVCDNGAGSYGCIVATCDPGYKAAGDATCVPGDCLGDGDCDDDNPCTDDSCEAGVCVLAPTPGGVCDYGDDCTIGGFCSGGVCQPGAPVDCSALNTGCDVGVCVLGACTTQTVPCGLSDAMAELVSGVWLAPANPGFVVVGTGSPVGESSSSGVHTIVWGF